jgi:hypothetical protein
MSATRAKAAFVLGPRRVAEAPEADIRNGPKADHAYSRRLKRKFAGSVSRQARARPKRGGALEIGREIRRKTAMHLARNLIGQDLTFPAFEGVERRPHDFLGRTLRRVEIACKVGVDESCMQRDDLGCRFRVRLQRAFPSGFERARSAVGGGSVATPERLSRRRCPNLPHREGRKAPQISHH